MFPLLLLLCQNLGPVLGNVTDTTATIWLRNESGKTARVTLAEDPSLTIGMQVSQADALAAFDFCQRFSFSGLRPESRHYYQVEMLDSTGLPVWTSQTWDFQTAPPPGQERTFSFAVLADMNSTASADGTAYLAAAANSPSFVVQLGDLDHRNPAEIGPQPVLESWRRMHRDHLGGFPAGQILTSSLTAWTPFVHVWDDHDYGANNADGTAPWKDRARRAFEEYFLLPAHPADGIWCSWTWGQAEFYLLDCRSQRSPDMDPDGPQKTMLGAAQKAWLLGALQGSQARWKLILSSSPWNPNGKPADGWGLYQTEQAEILAACAGTPGIIVISGDIHSGGALDDSTGWVELSVPATDVPDPPLGCSGNYGCGTWTLGLWTAGEPDGYAWVTVGPASVALEARGSDGSLRLAHTVQ